MSQIFFLYAFKIQSLTRTNTQMIVVQNQSSFQFKFGKTMFNRIHTPNRIFIAMIYRCI